MIHLGKHWLNLALDRGSPRPNTWGRVSKRTNNDDGRRFSRIGMVKREAEMAKRSGRGGGRFIRIGMVGDDDTAEELRIARKRSETNDQSRWIRIGVNQEHPDWGRIVKRAEGKEWNGDVDKFDSDLLEESVDVGGADVDDLWDNEAAEEEKGRTMRDEEEV